MTSDMLFKYYGVDWGAMISTFFMLYYLGNKKSQGFLFGILTSILWIIFNFMAESIPGVFANIVFIVLNLRSYWKWNKEHTAVVSNNDS